MKAGKKQRPKNSRHINIALKKAAKTKASQEDLVAVVHGSRNRCYNMGIYIINKYRVKKKIRKRISKVAIAIRETILILGGLFTLISTLKDLFFK